MQRVRLSTKQLRLTAHLSRFLLDELGWRRKEIRYFRTLVDKGVAQQALTRGAVAILYAHWEGFIKVSGSAYIEHVRLQQRPLGELSSNFWALASRRMANQSVDSPRWKLHIDLCDFIRTCQTDVARWPRLWSIDTRSNLTVRVFHDVVALLGIPYHPDFRTAEKPIIERLLQLRNSVAHGDDQTIELAEYHQLHDNVDALLQLFCNEVDNAAATERYLASKSQGKLPN